VEKVPDPDPKLDPEKWFRPDRIRIPHTDFKDDRGIQYGERTAKGRKGVHGVNAQ
jgi:hypothetical protein